jgi:molybdate transport repressor ModE-like protein
MFHVSVGYTSSSESPNHHLIHPLYQVLESVYVSGSIGKAAKQLGRSYRHVWGELKHWECELNADLIVWGKSGKGATLTPQALAFLLAISSAQAALAPQVAEIKDRLDKCVNDLKRTQLLI